MEQGRSVCYLLVDDEERRKPVVTIPYTQGASTAEKLRGDQGLRPNTGALAGSWVRMGTLPPAVRVPKYHPRKIFENSDAKSCILVTTCCQFFCFLKYTAKKLRDQYIVGPPT